MRDMSLDRASRIAWLMKEARERILLLRATD
jgi:hypothetical protein